MTSRCSAITRSGGRCQKPADGPHGLCWTHDPQNAERRKKMASRAGRARPNRELQAVKVKLRDLADRVLDGEIQRADAIAAGQILNVWLRATELQRKALETEELLERLQDLEARAGSRWAG